MTTTTPQPRLIKPTLRALLALSLFSTLTNPYAGEFRIDRLHVVGDSLSDGGTYTGTATQVLLGNGVPAGAIPPRMKFTTNSVNSPIWADVLASRLGIALDVDVINGVSAPNGGNYAQGGSRVSNPAGIGNNPGAGITTLPVTTQVDRLLADRPRFGSTDLIALWAGSNDGFVQFSNIANGTPIPTALANMSQAATELLAQIDRLKAAGAQNIVVVTVPNLGATPFATLVNGSQPGAANLLTSLANQFNTTLSTSAAGKGAVVVDSNRLLSAVLANPARYGFTSPTPTTPACGQNPSATGASDFYNSSLFCIQGVNAAADSEQRIFADGVHPTAAAQRLFGEAGFAGLQAATINGALVAAPLTPIRQHSISLENRLTAFALVQDSAVGKTTLRPLGDTQWYGGAEAGRFDSDTGQVQSGLKADTQVLKFGADRMITSNALIGFGLSIDEAQTRFANNAGGFNSLFTAGSVFGTMALSKQFYLNAALAFGTIDYDVERTFMLGTSQERYTASPKADFSSVRIGGGSIHTLGQGWTLNPQLAYTREQIELDGYDESSGAASLSYGSTSHVAKRLSLGVAVTHTPELVDGWRPLIRYSIESDLNNDDVVVRIGPDQNTLAAVRGPRPDTNFQLVSIGAAKPWMGGLINLSVNSTLGQSGLDSLSLSAAYKASF